MVTQDHSRVPSGVTTMLLGMWDEGSKTLTIRRPNGQTYKVPGTYITQGGYRVMGVETVGNEVHVLTAPGTNPRPSRRVKFTDSGMYSTPPVTAALRGRGETGMLRS